MPTFYRNLPKNPFCERIWLILAVLDHILTYYSPTLQQNTRKYKKYNKNSKKARKQQKMRHLGQYHGLLQVYFIQYFTQNQEKARIQHFQQKPRKSRVAPKSSISVQK